MSPTRKPAKIQKVTSDLNVILSKEQINEVLRTTLGAKGEKIKQVMIDSNACCVDASVASSVAGPFSGVASSVSVVGDNEKTIEAHLDQKAVQLGAEHIKVTTPANINVK